MYVPVAGDEINGVRAGMLVVRPVMATLPATCGRCACTKAVVATSVELSVGEVGVGAVTSPVPLGRRLRFAPVTLLLMVGVLLVKLRDGAVTSPPVPGTRARFTPEPVLMVGAVPVKLRNGAVTSPVPLGRRFRFAFAPDVLMLGELPDKLNEGDVTIPPVPGARARFTPVAVVIVGVLPDKFRFPAWVTSPKGSKFQTELPLTL